MGKRSKNAGTRSSRKRRGTGEDMTGAKANAVEVRAPVNTAELALPAPDDYHHHRKAIMGALEKKRTAEGLYRNALKSAQKAGIDTTALLQANSIVRANDPKGTARSLMQLAFSLQQEGFPILITVHDTLVGDEMETVYRRFYRDGKYGKPLASDYPAGSDLAAQAARAWRHGASANLGVSAEDSDKAVEGEEGEAAHKLPPPPDMTADQQQTTH